MTCTGLEAAVAGMFGAYTSCKGDDEKLSKGKFLKMLSEELPHFKDVPQKDRDAIFTGTDLNQDGQIEFAEFARLVSAFATAKYEILQQIYNDQKKAA